MRRGQQPLREHCDEGRAAVAQSTGGHSAVLSWAGMAERKLIHRRNRPFTPLRHPPWPPPSPLTLRHSVRRRESILRDLCACSPSCQLKRRRTNSRTHCHSCRCTRSLSDAHGCSSPLLSPLPVTTAPAVSTAPLLGSRAELMHAPAAGSQLASDWPAGVTAGRREDKPKMTLNVLAMAAARRDLSCADIAITDWRMCLRARATIS